MARIELADRNALPEEFKERFDVIEKSNGYIPNSYMQLAHRPPILKALMDLSKAVIRDEGTLDRGFRFLIAYISSRTAGCQFCQAHNISSASRWGISDDKLNAIWDYETSPLFTDAERAAFDYARGASVVPNAVTRRYFCAREATLLDAADCRDDRGDRAVRLAEPLQRYAAHRSRPAHARLGRAIRPRRQDRMGSERSHSGFTRQSRLKEPPMAQAAAVQTTEQTVRPHRVQPDEVDRGKSRQAEAAARRQDHLPRGRFHGDGGRRARTRAPTITSTRPRNSSSSSRAP